MSESEWTETFARYLRNKAKGGEQATCSEMIAALDEIRRLQYALAETKDENRRLLCLIPDDMR